jgi:hypothetical protein
MTLSPEDTLRLNVLLANAPLAIRIHEPSMTVFGLTRSGEARIPLHPTGRDERYIKAVKELISGHVLGSPGGYPIYLQRWTRMGQMRDESLEQLLLLGEPEAVVAAVCAPGLTDELARRAWWAMEDADNARRMLCREPVASGRMGPELAAYLVEHLPFETEPETMIETVRLVLQGDLLDTAAVEELWNKAQRRNAYYVGFLASRPDRLPAAAAPHPAHTANAAALAALAERGNAMARQLLRVLGPAGQVYLETVERVLKKPPNQDVVLTLFDVVRDYFAAMRPGGERDLELDLLRAEARAWAEGDDPQVVAIRREAPDLVEFLMIARTLSGLGYGVVRPVLKGTTAIGSLMRRKLEPVLTPLLRDLRRLRPG